MNGVMTESEYLRYLKHQRAMLAWCLSHYGTMAPNDAQVYAEEFYPFEPADQGRGFKFHWEAWDWAMRKLYGDEYHLEHSTLAKPSVEYQGYSATLDE